MVVKWWKCGGDGSGSGTIAMWCWCGSDYLHSCKKKAAVHRS